MIDLRPTIIAKSDQLNADDLLGRTLTVKITKVAGTGDADQPISIHFEGDDGKPYKPGKSMRRVLAKVWGEDGSAFVGRSMTLFCDERVQFGGLAVGGIRISHMSNIDRDVTMALTATRGSKKAYTVKPLKSERPAAVDLAPILTEGREAAARGSDALTAWWGRLNRDEKAAAKPTLDDELKAAAVAADETQPDTFDAEQVEAGAPQGEPEEGDFPGDRAPE